MVQIPLEGLADSLTVLFPYSRAKIWKSVFYHPDETFAAEAANASWMQGAKDIVISGIPVAILNVILMIIGVALVATLMPSLLPSGMSGATAFVGIGALLVFYIIAIPVAYTIGLVIWFIWAHVATFLAGLVGGSGKPLAFGYLSALSSASLSLIMLFVTIPLMVVGLIPILGAIISSIFQLAFGIWGFFIAFKAIKQAFKIDGLKALFVLIAPLLIIAAILFGLLMAIALIGFFPAIAK